MNAKIEAPVPMAGEDGQLFSPANGKVVLRLNLPGLKQAMVTLPRIKPRQPAVNLIQAALGAALARLEAADPEARRGDVEGIHRLRTSTRRLRSELQAVRELVEKDWREHLEQELKWLATMLGNVRDLDILSHRLLAAAKPVVGLNGTSGKLPGAESNGPLKLLFQDLEKRHARNSQVLREVLQGQRYRTLVADIQQAIADPEIKEEAWEPCRTALPPLIKDAWRRLRQSGRALAHDTPDEDFHEVRKLAKRARYTAELIAPALGRRTEHRAGRFIRLTTKVQDILGEHQDAIVAASEIEQFLANHSHDDASARAARHLLETQHQAALSARAQFFDSWNRLDRKKSTRWLKIKHGASV